MSKYLQIPYLCFFLLLAVWAVRQPHYTWDVLGYVGCAVDSTNAKVIQRAALDAIPEVSRRDFGGIRFPAGCAAVAVARSLPE
jgi:hypothetical protein